MWSPRTGKHRNYQNELGINWWRISLITITIQMIEEIISAFESCDMQKKYVMCSNVSELQACNSLGGFTIFGWILPLYRFCVENNPVKKILHLANPQGPKISESWMGWSLESWSLEAATPKSFWAPVPGHVNPDCTWEVLHDVTLYKRRKRIV